MAAHNLSVIKASTRALLALEEREEPFLLPSFSKDGKKLYYYARTGDREKSLSPHLFCLDLSTRESREIKTLRPVSATY